jgi:hypothetical protein
MTMPDFFMYHAPLGIIVKPSIIHESIVYVIIASVKSSEIHPLTLKRANNAIVRSTMSFAREMMIDLRLKRPNQCL